MWLNSTTAAAIHEAEAQCKDRKPKPRAIPEEAPAEARLATAETQLQQAEARQAAAQKDLLDSKDSLARANTSLAVATGPAINQWQQTVHSAEQQQWASQQALDRAVSKRNEMQSHVDGAKLQLQTVQVASDKLQDLTALQDELTKSAKLAPSRSKREQVQALLVQLKEKIQRLQLARAAAVIGGPNATQAAIANMQRKKRFLAHIHSAATVQMLEKQLAKLNSLSTEGGLMADRQKLLEQTTRTTLDLHKAKVLLSQSDLALSDSEEPTVERLQEALSEDFPAQPASAPSLSLGESGNFSKVDKALHADVQAAELRSALNYAMGNVSELSEAAKVLGYSDRLSEKGFEVDGMLKTVHRVHDEIKAEVASRLGFHRENMVVNRAHELQQLLQHLKVELHEAIASTKEEGKKRSAIKTLMQRRQQQDLTAKVAQVEAIVEHVKSIEAKVPLTTQIRIAGAKAVTRAQQMASKQSDLPATVQKIESLGRAAAEVSEVDVSGSKSSPRSTLCKNMSQKQAPICSALQQRVSHICGHLDIVGHRNCCKAVIQQWKWGQVAYQEHRTADPQEHEDIWTGSDNHWLAHMVLGKLCKVDLPNPASRTNVNNLMKEAANSVTKPAQVSDSTLWGNATERIDEIARESTDELQSDLSIMEADTQHAAAKQVAVKELHDMEEHVLRITLQKTAPSVSAAEVQEEDFEHTSAIKSVSLLAKQLLKFKYEPEVPALPIEEQPPGYVSHEQKGAQLTAMVHAANGDLLGKMNEYLLILRDRARTAKTSADKAEEDLIHLKQYQVTLEKIHHDFNEDKALTNRTKAMGLKVQVQMQKASQTRTDDLKQAKLSNDEYVKMEHDNAKLQRLVTLAGQPSAQAPIGNAEQVEQDKKLNAMVQGLDKVANGAVSEDVEAALEAEIGKVEEPSLT